jgi:superfamily II DNA or RNA helicase
VPTDEDALPTVTMALRGRDLMLTLPSEWWASDDKALFTLLFGSEVATHASVSLVRDERNKVLRARPYDFSRLRRALLEHGACSVQVAFEEHPLLPMDCDLRLVPRPYQDEALTVWRAAGNRGVVVLPTGAGKTALGAMALADMGLWTLVVVPTLDLLRQWRAALVAALTGVEESVGLYGGGARDLRPITITTYESAQLHPELLNRFGLLIFDECHHLPAPSYRQIAEGAFTPYRLGLSATPERADQEHTALERLIGPEVYRRHPAELAAERYLAAYDEQRMPIPLTPEERERYNRARGVYQDFLARRRIAIRSPADFQRRVVWASARDHEARAAMLAWREARSLAMNAPAKLDLLETLFARHRDERVLVFCDVNALVDQISRRFCMPQLTHKTPTEERQAILDRFRSGHYTKLVTGRVLNEGVDVPDCAVGVIVSGSATRREYVQRLGRVLRPKERRAVLYELVTEETTEERVSERRREQS